MKRLTAIVLILVMALTLASCGKGASTTGKGITSEFNVQE